MNSERFLYRLDSLSTALSKSLDSVIEVLTFIFYLPWYRSVSLNSCECHKTKLYAYQNTMSKPKRLRGGAANQKFVGEPLAQPRSGERK
jgi:hypothetical protein